MFGSDPGLHGNEIRVWILWFFQGLVFGSNNGGPVLVNFGFKFRVFTFDWELGID